MERTTFRWQRFWCPPEGRIVLGDEGFLTDPESVWGHISNPDVQPVDLLAEVPCIVLLGEPGSGKSTTLEAERIRVESRLAEAGQEVLWLDLHEVGSDAQLWRRLFDTAKFSDWKQSDRELTLFLDSLDECRVQINTLPYLLIGEFRRIPVERLRLRIACRTADWPPALDRGLRELWGDDAVQVFELAPLRRTDVRLAADTLELGPDPFVDAVRQAGVVPLAIKPLTLDFLLRTFQHRGGLPVRQADLYREGCRLLCEESPQRQELRLPRLLDAEQRLAVAERIAALTVFANRAAVASGTDPGDSFNDDLIMRALSGGTEVANGDSFSVSERGIQETLNTGLFNSRGEQRLGWAHRTYAEFLAARYVAGRGFSLPQIMSLLVHPADPEGKLVPQLHETAAWLAGMRADVFHAILPREPEVLLRSDVGGATDADREALVSVLLQAIEAGDWVDRDWELRQRYAQLRHSTLASQLRPYITDSAKGAVVRRVAIDIAEACEERTLLGDLVGVALDADTPVHTRVNAAYAVIRIGDDGSRGQLRALIDTPAEVDPDAELKGCGLLATWPGRLPTTELLRALTPSRTNLFGAYRNFLYDDPIQHVPPEDLPTALEWAKRHADHVTIPPDTEDLISAVIRHAWHHLGDPTVLDGFTAVALTRIRHADPILDRDSVHLLQEDVEQRRLALAGVVAAADGEKDLRLLTPSGLVTPDDALWLLGQYQSRPDPEKDRWGLLLRYVLRYEDREAVDAALTVRETDSRLGSILAPLFDPIRLDSEEADRQRELHRMMTEQQEQSSRVEPLVQPPPNERVARLLKLFDDGNLSAWWQLNGELSLEPRSRKYGNDFESDLTVQPGWRDASLATRGALAAAAERYVREAVPDPEQWIVAAGNRITIHRPDWAGFRAFRLLLTEAPDLLAALPADVWVRWAPVLVAFPTLNPSDRDAPHQHLVAHAYRHAPSEVLSALDRLIDAEHGREHESADRLLWRVALCWDEQLATAIREKARDRAVSSTIMGQLLEALLDHGVEAAIPFAVSLIPMPLPADETDRDRAVIAASVLLRKASSKGWPTVWPALLQDHAFAEAVLARFVWDDRHTGEVAAGLTDAQIADLYVWLSQKYPPGEDREINGFVDYRAAVGQWRDSLLTHLRLRGTEGACRAIVRLVSALPEQEWLKWTLLDAKTLTLQRTWVPPTPEEVRALAQSAERRLVQNADELLDVVVESLRRLEQKLQLAEPPRAIELWNEVARNTFRPKDEERLSDYIKGHLDDELRDRGIVFNREVVNRRGEETDIRVEALLRPPHGDVLDLLTVIIEVKGCWHKEMESAMETQLLDRYLSGTDTSHGLYVVGWYNCDKWDRDDWRNRRAPGYDWDEAQRRLDAQAVELSRGGKHIRALVLDTSLKY